MADKNKRRPDIKADLPPEPEKIRDILEEKQESRNQQGAPASHPDVKAEKDASRATSNPRKGPHERIVNPKTNTSNQYR